MGWEGDWGITGGPSVNGAEGGLRVGEGERDGVLRGEDVDVADSAVCCSKSDITKQ